MWNPLPHTIRAGKVLHFPSLISRLELPSSVLYIAWDESQEIVGAECWVSAVRSNGNNFWWMFLYSRLWEVHSLLFVFLFSFRLGKVQAHPYSLQHLSTRVITSFDVCESFSLLAQRVFLIFISFLLCWMFTLSSIFRIFKYLTFSGRICLNSTQFREK